MLFGEPIPCKVLWALLQHNFILSNDGRKKQRRTWGLTMSLATPGVFSESRMREIYLSGSMSGNRKQNQAKAD